MREERKRQISDPYLCAHLFLNLRSKPKPVIDDSGRVAFEFPDNEETDKAIESFYKDDQIGAFSYSGAIKAVKSIIFAVKPKGRNRC